MSPRPGSPRGLPGGAGFLSPLHRRLLVFLAALVPAGFALQAYSGPARWWVNNWAASFAYEIFFMTLALFVAPAPRRLPAIAVGVAAGTIALEFLQLWRPPWLEAIRATSLGRDLLGNRFSWKDLPAYPLGCALGWWWLRALARGPGRP